MVSDEFKKKERLIKERINQKERLKQIMIERQQHDVLRHREVNSLKRMDQQELIQREQAMMKEFKNRIARKIHQTDNIKNDIQLNLKLMHGNGQEKQLQMEERLTIDQFNPGEVLSKARMDLSMQLQGLKLPPGLKSGKAAKGL